MAERRAAGLRAVAAGSGLVLATLLAICPGVLRGETLFLRDLSVFHRPLRRLLLDLIASSEGLPSWNPFSHFGQPFAANPNAGVFDPWSLLFLVLPFDLAFNLQVLLPLLVGAAGFALLVRERGGSRFAAAFGALSWGLGGCVLSVSSYLQMHHSVAFLPLALALALRLVRAPSAAAAATLALVLGAQGLAGCPTSLMLTAFLLPFAVWEAWPTRDSGEASPRRRSALRGLALALLLGASIGAATWLPALGLLRQTGRVADESFGEEAAGWSLPPQRLLELAAPRAFGHVVPETVGMYWGRGLYGWRQWPYLFSLYGGLAALVLAITATLARRSRDRPWMLAGAVGLLLAFGAHLPGWALLLRVLPPLAVVRFPEKWAVAPALVLALLAARGLDLVLTDEGAARRARRLSLGLLAFLGGATALLLVAGPGFWSRLWSLPDWLAAEASSIAVSDFALQALLAALLSAAFFVRRMRAHVLPLLLIALTCVDLVFAGRCLMPTEAPAFFDQPPAVLAPLLGAAEGERTLFQYADWKQHEVRRGGRELPLEAPVPWQWGIATALEKDFDGTHLTWSRTATRELLALMADEPELVGEILARRGVSAVLRPPVSGELGALTLLATRSPRPFAFAAEAVLERGETESQSEAFRRAGPALVLEPGAAAPARPAPAEVFILERSPTRILLRARAAGESVIALNLTWHSDWRAFLDGEPAPLLLRDGHLSALVLPEGEHELLLRYRSLLLELGVLLSGLGVLAATACLIAGVGTRLLGT